MRPTPWKTVSMPGDGGPAPAPTALGESCCWDRGRKKSHQEMHSGCAHVSELLLLEYTEAHLEHLCFRMRKPFLKLPVKSDLVEPPQTILETEDWEGRRYEGPGQSLGKTSGPAREAACRLATSPQPRAPGGGAGISIIGILQTRKLRLAKFNEAAQDGAARQQPIQDQNTGSSCRTATGVTSPPSCRDGCDNRKEPPRLSDSWSVACAQPTANLSARRSPPHTPLRCGLTILHSGLFFYLIQHFSKSCFSIPHLTHSSPSCFLPASRPA